MFRAEQPQSTEVDPATRAVSGNERSYAVRDRRQDLRGLNEQQLRARRDAAYLKVLARARSRDHADELALLLGDGSTVGVCAIEGDSVMAELVSEMYAARDLLAELRQKRLRERIIRVPNILDDGDTL